MRIATLLFPIVYFALVCVASPAASDPRHERTLSVTKNFEGTDVVNAILGGRDNGNFTAMFQQLQDQVNSTCTNIASLSSQKVSNSVVKTIQNDVDQLGVLINNTITAVKAFLPNILDKPSSIPTVITAVISIVKNTASALSNAHGVKGVSVGPAARFVNGTLSYFEQALNGVSGQLGDVIQTIENLAKLQDAASSLQLASHLYVLALVFVVQALAWSFL